MLHCFTVTCDVVECPRDKLVPIIPYFIAVINSCSLNILFISQFWNRDRKFTALSRRLSYIRKLTDCYAALTVKTPFINVTYTFNRQLHHNNDYMLFTLFNINNHVSMCMSCYDRNNDILDTALNLCLWFRLQLELLSVLLL